MELPPTLKNTAAPFSRMEQKRHASSEREALLPWCDPSPCPRLEAGGDKEATAKRVVCCRLHRLLGGP